MMITPELIKKIRHIELRTKKILSGSLLGDYKTKQKGFGLEFEQLSEYQFGDDIRFIDWKSSARMNKILIKEYREERNRTIMLLVDGSHSNFFGSKEQLKHEQVAEIASIISLTTQFQKDHIGLIIVTDEIECFIPPKSGKKHIHNVMETLFVFKPKAKNTKLSVGLKHLMKVKRHDTLTFLISDFIDDNFEKDLRIVAKKHELIAIRCLDEVERTIPRCGIIECQDIETGEQISVNTHDLKFAVWLEERNRSLSKLFQKYSIDHLDIVPGSYFIDTMILLFAQRMR